MGGSDEGPPSTLQTTGFFVTSYMDERCERALYLCFMISVSLMRSPFAWPNYLTKPNFLILLYWELEFQYMNFVVKYTLSPLHFLFQKVAYYFKQKWLLDLLICWMYILYSLNVFQLLLYKRTKERKRAIMGIADWYYQDECIPV
jgi:hypothetical protein